MLPGERPEFLRRAREVGVVLAVFVSTVVSKPAVETGADHLEPRGYVRIVGQECIRAIQKPVLEENNRFANVTLPTGNPSDSEEHKNVAIFRGNLMSLSGVAVELG